MDDIYKILNEGFEFGQQTIAENDQIFAVRRFIESVVFHAKVYIIHVASLSQNVESIFQTYVDRAKEVLAQRNGNPKPLKRAMRMIQDESEDEVDVPVAKKVSTESLNSEAGDSRPLRTAKSKANLHLVNF